MFGFGDIGKDYLSANDIEYAEQPKDKLLEDIQNTVLVKESFAKTLKQQQNEKEYVAENEYLEIIKCNEMILLHMHLNNLEQKKTFANDGQYIKQLLIWIFLFVCTALCISARYDIVEKDEDKLEVKEKNLEKSHQFKIKVIRHLVSYFYFLCQPFTVMALI